jgi:hypothetical protein
MQLVACSAPNEPLESAPRSALLAEAPEGEQWEGFWSADVYFVRRITEHGQTEWFRLADEDVSARATGAAARRADGQHTTRVLTFPTKARLQTRVVVAQGPDGRRMLVGNAQRASRRVSSRASE